MPDPAVKEDEDDAPPQPAAPVAKKVRGVGMGLDLTNELTRKLGAKNAIKPAANSVCQSGCQHSWISGPEPIC